MAASKYTGLQGIASDQPDIYETSDLPEADQQQNQNDDSDVVEKLTVSATDAYNKFKDSRIDSKSADFSDNIGRRKRIGYEDARTEYEMQAAGVEESPLQKYQRLQHEIRELADLVASMKEAAQATVPPAVPVVVSRQVEYLQQQLSDLQLDHMLGLAGPVNLSDPQGMHYSKLVSEIESFKNSASKVKAADDASAGSTGSGAKSTGVSGDGSHITYQLYYRPEQAKFTSSVKVADLEQRLERIEALVGANPEKLASGFSDVPNKSIMGAMENLSSRVRVLEPGQVEQVEGRLQTLLYKMSQLAEKKEAALSSEKFAKVAELYEIVKKWDTVANTVPHVVDRLVALQELHEQAMRFSQTLTHLDVTQQQISSHLVNQQSLLTQVQTSMDTNLSTIKTNCDSLDARVKALVKK